MAGKTKMLISLWSTKFVHIPIKMAVIDRNKVNPNGSFGEMFFQVRGNQLA